MLYLLKSGQVASRQGLAELIGRDQATITRWLKKYKDGGLKGLLEVKSAPGKVALVSSEALERLKQRLRFLRKDFIAMVKFNNGSLANWDWTSPIKLNNTFRQRVSRAGKRKPIILQKAEQEPHHYFPITTKISPAQYDECQFIADDG